MSTCTDHPPTCSPCSYHSGVQVVQTRVHWTLFWVLPTQTPQGCPQALSSSRATYVDLPSLASVPTQWFPVSRGWASLIHNTIGCSCPWADHAPPHTHTHIQTDAVLGFNLSQDGSLMGREVAKAVP